VTKLRVAFSNVQRGGAWTVPQDLYVRVLCGNAELDLREAHLEPGVTTIRVHITMGNLEVTVPPDLALDVDVQSVGGNVDSSPSTGARDPAKPLVRFVGVSKLGNFEVHVRQRGECRKDQAYRERLARKARKHERHRERWRRMHEEREMWMRGGRHSWWPWWLQARMRRRTFSWLAIAFAGGVAVGYYHWDHARWWHILLFAIVLSIVSGAIAVRMTRPLLMAIRAAQDIGEGKLDTRLDVDRHRGETRLLALALNDMAARIEQQLKDQRQLLAAVSHELRTPLGHMRVLIETARDQASTKPLDELEREVLVLDDLVGKLLASSRLEFGNLDRRDIDLGQLVTDVVTGAGIAPEAIEANGDVRANVDPTLISRAVANLVDNARVHGGGATAVRIERRAGQVVIEVDDAGPGVPVDRRADAFRAFVPSSAGGLGLGLALVSRIAVAHGGGAWIGDCPGGGARVGFTVAAA
jgi:signal transduction histidine kinase